MSAYDLQVRRTRPNTRHHQRSNPNGSEQFRRSKRFDHDLTNARFFFGVDHGLAHVGYPDDQPLGAKSKSFNAEKNQTIVDSKNRS